VSENKELTFNKGGIIICLTEKKEIKATNNTKESFNVDFVDPATGHLGYTNKKFVPSMWCLSNPITWAQEKTTGIVDVIFTAEEKRFRIRVDIHAGTFTDLTNPSIKVSNFISETKKITVIIPAFEAQDFIEKCINGFLSQVDRSGEIELEILVGIDSCWKTLKEVSKKTYPENVKFYYFKENVGPYYIRNTLSLKAQNEILVFFDSDDVPGTNLLLNVASEIDAVNIVNWKFLWFDENDQIVNGNKLELGFLTLGVFAIKKIDLFERNGFYHWRVGADSEFHERARSKGMSYKSIQEPLFFRRRLETSLTRNNITGHKTPMRRAYNEIVDENSIRGFFPDPSELRIVDCMRV
jgi:hypothetical protein